LEVLKRKDQISGAFWLFVAAVIIWQSLELKIGSYRSPGSGYIPLAVGVGMGIVSLIIIIRATLFVREAPPFSLGISAPALKKLGIVVAGIFLYALLFTDLGFVLSTFLFLVLLFKSVEPQRWPTAILWAGGATFLAYLLFCITLQCELPRGFWGI
jgi:putative tricarboxylic transport membrane protein